MSSIKLESNASGTGIFTLASPNSNTNRTLTIPDATTTIVGTDATQTLTNKTLGSGLVAGASLITSDTAKTATSTSVDFTGIPSWVKRITVMFSNVSLSATADILVQIGTSSGIEATGYVSGSGNASNSTTGYVIRMANAARTAYGVMQITNITGNNWVSFHSVNAGTTTDFAGGGGKTLGGVLTQVRITSSSTDTFDSGTINIFYE